MSDIDLAMKYKTLYEASQDALKEMSDELVAARAEIEQLRITVVAQDDAAKEVQDHWSDPGAYTHNRLLTPQLVHETTITEARRALEARRLEGR